MTPIRPAGLPFPAPQSASPLARPSGARPAPAPAAAAEPAASFMDVLTPEEREFFAQLSAMGSLTYRPGSADTPAAPTGQRIDVRA